MSETVTVAQVLGQGQPYGPQGNVIPYTVVFQEHPGMSVQWGRTSPPNVGDTATGVIDHTSPNAQKFGPKFIRDKPPGGYTDNAGGGGKSPEEDSRIVRQHSQEMALRLLAQTKTLTDWDVSSADHAMKAAMMALIQGLTDWFQKDVERGVELLAARAAYGQGLQPTGVSDVPAPQQNEFQHPQPAAAPDEDPIPF